MKKFIRVFSLILGLGLCSPSAFAVSPLSQYFDLVAGQGDPGYRDGTFTSSMFRGPSAAAFSEDMTKIFVADTGNHRVRVVDLEHQNIVSTLAGTGAKGAADGVFEAATFNSPTRIVSLSGNRLVVFDSGTNRLRLLDFSSKKVTTLLGGNSNSPDDALSGIGGLAADPKENVVYFSQPDSRSVKKLNLATMKVSTVFADDPRLPLPLALCFLKGRLCVADKDLPTVFQVEPAANNDSAVVLTEIARGEKIVALAASDDMLYAFQGADIPWARLTESPGFTVGEVKFMSLWAPFLEPKSQELQGLLNFLDPNNLPGFLPFPNDPRRFIWVSPDKHQVFALRDYAFNDYKDSAQFAMTRGINHKSLTDYDYPFEKPPRTFRILMLGDSRIFYEKEGEQNRRWPWGFHRQETIPKKLEAMLNFQASIEDVPTRFQVLTYARYRGIGALHLWPNFCDVDLPRRFDVDAVILFMPNDLELSDWFSKPYTKEGLPNLAVNDAEFMLKPMKEKLPPRSRVSSFYDRCVAHQWVAKDQWIFSDLSILSEDPKVMDDLSEMVAQSFGLYRDKLKKMGDEKKHPIPLYVFFSPLGSVGAPLLVEPYRKLYAEACRKSGVQMEDLTDALTALKISAYPTSEFWVNYHFDHNGHSLVSYLIAHRLIKRGLVPFSPDGH